MYALEELYKRATRTFALAVETARTFFGRHNVDGVTCDGNKIGRFRQLRFCDFGILLLWKNRTERLTVAVELHWLSIQCEWTLFISLWDIHKDSLIIVDFGVVGVYKMKAA